VSVIIEIGRDWRIMSEEHAWAVQERGKGDPHHPGGWRSIAWLPHAHAALQEVGERRLRRVKGPIQECMGELRQIRDEICAAAHQVEAAVARVTRAA